MKMIQLIKRVKSTLLSSVEELKKCKWPNKEELVSSTILVCFYTFLTMFAVWSLDFMFQELIFLLVK